MRIRAPYELPAHKKGDLGDLIRLEWWNLGARFSIVLVLWLVLGNSQAMRAAWLEDIFTMIPPIAFLLAVRVRNRPPDETFPYGYERAAVIAFLGTAVVLTGLGGFIIIESSMKLIRQERTSIGAIQLFGHTFWMGWLMIAALLYSITPPFIIGRLQASRAKKVHEKVVHVDSKISKADWMTGAAGIVGVLGVGLGLWWADALAAAVIGVDVLKDGLTNLKEAVGDLLDRRPRLTGTGEPDPLIDELEDHLRQMPWVQDAAVRLREEGHVLTGEAFVVPVSDEGLAKHLDDASRELAHFDWRIYEIVVTAVPEIRHQS